MSHVLREHLPLGLKDAKGHVDAVLAGHTVSFTLDDSAHAAALAQALEDAGAVVTVECDASRSSEGET